MQRSPSAALLPLGAALERLLLGVQRVHPRRLPPALALGAAASEDVAAPADLPAGAVAGRDGWAVLFGAVAGASPGSPVTLAAAPPWVDAGAAMPAGTDTVLPPDAFEPDPANEVSAEAAPGEGVIGAGTEFRAGDPILLAGSRIGPQHLLALGCAGIREVGIRVPRVALLETAGAREHGALGPALAALARACGAETAPILAAEEGLLATARAIASAAESADLVFVIGGTGFGRTDCSAAALARAGTLALHGVALRPGETAGFGSVAGCPVLLLPGRPDAALAAFLALGRPLLGRLAGLAEPPARLSLPLSRKVSSALGLSEIVFLRRGAAGLEALGGSDIPLRRLLQVEGALLVPPDREGYPQGAAVEMMPVWSPR